MRAVNAARELDDRGLMVPVEGVQREALVQTFDDARGGGRRHGHERQRPEGHAASALRDLQDDGRKAVVGGNPIDPYEILRKQ